ncbi:MAG TPA: hypothetical protein VKR06_33040, partial [Ktedonosporobacter sp.]|nr:hypothetical protein [Ktedonosporobacter sp.]
PLKDFAFSLMCHMPDACAYRVEQGDDPEGTAYTYLFHSGAFLRWGPQDVRGNRALWQDLLRSVSDFQKAGRPRREQYTAQLDNDGHLVFSLPGWQWSLY